MPLPRVRTTVPRMPVFGGSMLPSGRGRGYVHERLRLRVAGAARTFGQQRACAWIQAHYAPIRAFYLEANLVTDKKSSHLNSSKA